MNRKLHNTLTALAVACVTLAACFAIGGPAASHAPGHAAPILANGQDDGTGAERATGVVRTARARHSVAMPFFSFSPRG